MIIPYEQLSPEALHGVIEEIVTRSGTELSDAQVKVAQVMRLLKAGTAVIVFDPRTSTCNIVPADAAADEPEDEG